MMKKTKISNDPHISNDAIEEEARSEEVFKEKNHTEHESLLQLENTQQFFRENKEQKILTESLQQNQQTQKLQLLQDSQNNDSSENCAFFSQVKSKKNIQGIDANEISVEPTVQNVSKAEEKVEKCEQDPWTYQEIQLYAECLKKLQEKDPEIIKKSTYKRFKEILQLYNQKAHSARTLKELKKVDRYLNGKFKNRPKSEILQKLNTKNKNFNAGIPFRSVYPKSNEEMFFNFLLSQMQFFKEDSSQQENPKNKITFNIRCNIPVKNKDIVDQIKRMKAEREKKQQYKDKIPDEAKYNF